MTNTVLCCASAAGTVFIVLRLYMLSSSKRLANSDSSSLRSSGRSAHDAMVSESAPATVSNVRVPFITCFITLICFICSSTLRDSESILIVSAIRSFFADTSAYPGRKCLSGVAKIITDISRNDISVKMHTNRKSDSCESLKWNVSSSVFSFRINILYLKRILCKKRDPQLLISY